MTSITPDTPRLEKKKHSLSSDTIDVHAPCARVKGSSKATIQKSWAQVVSSTTSQGESEQQERLRNTVKNTRHTIPDQGLGVPRDVSPIQHSKKFQALEVTLLDRFEDERFIFISIYYPVKQYKSLFKSWKGLKLKAVEMNSAIQHPQEIRHSSKALNATSPTGGQLQPAFSDDVSTSARFIVRNWVALLRVVTTKSAETDASGPCLIPFLPGGDLVYDKSCQSLLNTNKSSVTLSPATTIDTFMRVMTENSRDQLLWTRRLAWIHHLTRFHLPFIYDYLTPPSHWQDKPLRLMQTNLQEKPNLWEESLIMLVQCPSLTPLCNTVVEICSKHSDTLNTVNDVRASPLAPPPAENSDNPSHPVPLSELAWSLNFISIHINGMSSTLRECMVAIIKCTQDVVHIQETKFISQGSNRNYIIYGKPKQRSGVFQSRDKIEIRQNSNFTISRGSVSGNRTPDSRFWRQTQGSKPPQKKMIGLYFSNRCTQQSSITWKRNCSQIFCNGQQAFTACGEIWIVQ